MSLVLQFHRVPELPDPIEVEEDERPYRYTAPEHSCRSCGDPLEVKATDYEGNGHSRPTLAAGLATFYFGATCTSCGCELGEFRLTFPGGSTAGPEIF